MIGDEGLLHPFNLKERLEWLHQVKVPLSQKHMRK